MCLVSKSTDAKIEKISEIQFADITTIKKIMKIMYISEIVAKNAYLYQMILFYGSYKILNFVMVSQRRNVGLKICKLILVQLEKWQLEYIFMFQYLL